MEMDSSVFYLKDLPQSGLNGQTGSGIQTPRTLKFSETL